MCSDVEGPVWISAVLLAQIVVWAFALRPSRAGRRFETSDVNARDAGLQALAAYLEAMIERKKVPEHPLLSETDKINPTQALQFFVHLGGFKRFARALSWSSLHRKMRKARAKIDTVYLLVEYLARTAEHEERVLATAYHYVATCSQDNSRLSYGTIELCLEPVGVEAITKYWQSYRSSAPIIFAVRRHFPSLFEHRTAEAFMAELYRACLDTDKLLRVLGEAAFAARLIAEASTQFEDDAYRRIEPVAPQLPGLSPQEKDEIASVNRERREAPDPSPDYRAKTRKPRKR
jgi:hypothetical protein